MVSISLSLSWLSNMHAYIAITDEDGRLQEKLLELQASFNGQFIPAQETGTVSYLYICVWTMNVATTAKQHNEARPLWPYSRFRLVANAGGGNSCDIHVSQ